MTLSNSVSRVHHPLHFCFWCRPARLRSPAAWRKFAHLLSRERAPDLICASETGAVNRSAMVFLIREPFDKKVTLNRLRLVNCGLTIVFSRVDD